MAINPFKPQNNHRLLCYKLPKDTTNPQDLIRTKQVLCPFYAGINSEIENNPETLGSKLQVNYDTFEIETYDFVEEIVEGDLIYITNFKKAFNVDSKSVFIPRKVVQYARYSQMPKATRFRLRGKL